ncbi:MAG: peptidase-C39 like family protein [Legionellales bacterium RIFCSPHIGHO2_12_FULL_37_14]|nr:MAG: peptidase-C39 like family protein [Legionellales bacterium RIFCSPHIGHO2_12_FULL_37_14]
MLAVEINAQPDDETCGPTCLHAIYKHYNFNITHEQVIKEVERSLSGGTLAALLGKHALRNNFSVSLYANNIRLLDPSWFWHADDAKTNQYLIEKLRAQRPYQEDPGIIQDSKAIESFLELGGKLKFRTINPSLLKKYFNKGVPIITGLSSTYLYRCPRERFTEEGKSIYDDLRGMPCGHFVILSGYDENNRLVLVADPHRKNPISHNNYYKVSVNRLINAIMLGVFTHDANLLIIQPKEKPECKPS